MKERGITATTRGVNGLGPLDSRARVDLNGPMNEMQGTLGELNSWIGVVISLTTSADVREVLPFVQHDLCYLSDQIGLQACTLLSGEHLARIDSALERLTPNGATTEKDPSLPSGPPPATFALVAREICRRAERQLFGMLELESTVGVAGFHARVNTNDLALNYLERLATLLWVVSSIETR
jgi:cob(I)alamin adenosyltransferase